MIKYWPTGSKVLSCGKKHSTNLSSRESNPINQQIFPTRSASWSLPDRSFEWTSRGVLFAKILWLLYRILYSITCIAFRVTESIKNTVPPFCRYGDMDSNTWGLQWLEKDELRRRQLESRRQRKVSCLEHACTLLKVNYVAQVTLSRLLCL